VASNYFILNGQLVSDGSDFFSMYYGMAYEKFQANPAIGNVSTTFSVNSTGILNWDSATFSGGKALWCQQPNGEIDALFSGPNNGNYPPNCTPVLLTVIPRK